jgi:predicted dehydrogenase
MINWGILGFGGMGIRFAEAIKETSNSKLLSTASKSGKTFEDFKNQTYENVIKSKDIHAIYISTLNNTLIELIKEIIKQNKKILCEKPVSTTLKDLLEVKKLIDEKKIQFYEAIAYYSHPQTQELINLINNDEIGEIQSIESNFGYKAKFKPSSRIFDKSLGGGSIFDLGCYPISFVMLFAKNPEKITIDSKNLSYAKSGVDDDATALLNYDNKFQGKIHVSIKNNLNNICIIRGSKGSLKINEPWKPDTNSIIEVTSKKHFYIKSISSKLTVYANQIERVAESFINEKENSNLFNINKSLINMKLMDNWLKN